MLKRYCVFIDLKKHLAQNYSIWKTIRVISNCFQSLWRFIEIRVFPAASLWLAMQNWLELFGIPKKMLDEAAVTSNAKI